ncbi:hypothetical protein ES707_18918 [subsurface metagenome]
MSTPEWSIFDRLDELEDITLGLMEKAETTEPTLKDAYNIAKDASILGKLGFLLAFVHTAVRASNPRETKGTWTHVLKVSGLSESVLKSVEDSMVKVCESVE